MPHFEKSSLSKYDHKLSRAPISRQLLKICYSCEKGFCPRKGRSKAHPVSNQAGRYICEKCADRVINGQTIKGIALLPEHDLISPRPGINTPIGS